MQPVDPSNPPTRIHPSYSRLTVSQDGFHVAVDINWHPETVQWACRLLDDAVEETTGYLNPTRQWSWLDRRNFYLTGTSDD